MLPSLDKWGRALTGELINPYYETCALCDVCDDDDKDDENVQCRGPFGICPLFYCLDKTALFFRVDKELDAHGDNRLHVEDCPKCRDVVGAFLDQLCDIYRQQEWGVE